VGPKIYGTKPIFVRKINETARTIARLTGQTKLAGLMSSNIQLAADQQFIGV
jgi:hypothetical protein